MLRDNIAFFDLNSISGIWVNNPHNAYPVEFMAELKAKYINAGNNLIYTDLVHAIVSVSSEGEIRIEGMKGELLYGVTPESTGNLKFDASSVYRGDVSVLSAHFRLYPQLE